MNQKCFCFCLLMLDSNPRPRLSLSIGLSGTESINTSSPSSTEATAMTTLYALMSKAKMKEMYRYQRIKMAKDSLTGPAGPVRYRKPRWFYLIYVYGCGQSQGQLRGLALTSRTLGGTRATQTREAISPFFFGWNIVHYLNYIFF